MIFALLVKNIPPEILPVSLYSFLAVAKEAITVADVAAAVAVTAIAVAVAVTVSIAFTVIVAIAIAVAVAVTVTEAVVEEQSKGLTNITVSFLTTLKRLAHVSLFWISSLQTKQNLGNAASCTNRNNDPGLNKSQVIGNKSLVNCVVHYFASGCVDAFEQNPELVKDNKSPLGLPFQASAGA